MGYLKRRSDASAVLMPDGYIALVVPDTDMGFTLPPAGALLWEFCDGTMTFAEMVDAVKDAGIPVPTEELSTNLQQIVNDLIAQKFLVEVDQAADLS